MSNMFGLDDSWLDDVKRTAFSLCLYNTLSVAC